MWNKTVLCSLSVVSTGCRSQHYDLVFLLDASSSVGNNNFQLVRQWVSDLVGSFDIAPGKTRVGVVRYSDDPISEFDLDTYSSAVATQRAAQNIRYSGGNTQTGNAIAYVVQNVFSEAAGARPLRPGISRVLILLTDGRSQDPVLGPALQAHKAGIRIFAIGVGEAVREELGEVASEPDTAHVFHVSDYEAIDRIRDQLRQRICQSKFAMNVHFPSTILFFQLQCQLTPLSPLTPHSQSNHPTLLPPSLPPSHISQKLPPQLSPSTLPTHTSPTIPLPHSPFSKSPPHSHPQSCLLPLPSHLHLFTPPPQILNCLLPPLLSTLSPRTTEPFLLLILPPPLAILQSPILFQQPSLPPPLVPCPILPLPSHPLHPKPPPSLSINSVDLKYPVTLLKRFRSFHTGCH
uniref:VWFA domain-containing protein n=1 Tax=Eptatretus burgeri TaxID=7764 RepID=A0A8C4R0B2_EPTBU